MEQTVTFRRIPHKTMNTVIRSIAILFLLGLVACSGTRLVSSWRDPAVSVDANGFNKILMISLIKDDATRRKAEDHMVEHANGHGLASYDYIGTDLEALNAPGMMDKLSADGIDAIAIMRLTDKSKVESFTPGTVMPSYYASPYAYYDHAAPMYNDPAYIHADVSYLVETNVYSTKQNKMIWTGTTNTVNPLDLGNGVDEIMKAIIDRMKKEGFIRST